MNKYCIEHGINSVLFCFSKKALNEQWHEKNIGYSLIAGYIHIKEIFYFFRK